jgi:nicotinate-nucleotide adenylyltransferase
LVTDIFVTKTTDTPAALERHCVGLFGGTFDPIHYGHLRMALELKQELGFDDMRLLPCHLPPHRQMPGRSSAHRAAMVRLAVEGCESLAVDARELNRERPSYTVDTLEELREELGAEVSISWCMGMDSLVNLSKWHRWRELSRFAHLVVVSRPGWEIPSDGELGAWVRDHHKAPQSLKREPSGSLVIVPLSLLEISATQIREQIESGRSPRFLLPDPVWHYIEEKQLYLTRNNTTDES